MQADAKGRATCNSLCSFQRPFAMTCGLCPSPEAACLKTQLIEVVSGDGVCEGKLECKPSQSRGAVLALLVPFDPDSNENPPANMAACSRLFSLETVLQ